MKRKVLHLIRKDAQLRASFIQNQIAEHVHFAPLICFRKRSRGATEGGFAPMDLERYPHIDLTEAEAGWERFLYNTWKRLSGRQVARLLRFIDEEGISICHFHYGTDCGAYYPLLKRLGIPSVVSFYGYDCSSFPRYLHGFGGYFLRTRVFADVSIVLAMSPDMKKDLIAAGCPKEKVCVHYYGTDCSRFHLSRGYLTRGSVRLLILASLVPQKGHLFLLDSLQELAAGGFDGFDLRIVGTGELEEKLKRKVRNAGLSAQVTFVGAIPYASDEMMEEYRSADVFVHPSVTAENGDKEGIPGTMIEAMATGLPVISTYHAGIPYVIKDGETGLLVKEWDTSGLAQAIKRLAQDPGLRGRLGRAGQDHAMSYLNLGEKEKELEAIYASLMD